MPPVVGLYAAPAFVAFAEPAALASSYASKFNYKVDLNQEMVALGAANVGSGFSGGFVVDGSLSKTAVSVGTGARTQVVSIIAGAAVLITTVFLTPLFFHLPEATLAAIVIHAVLRLINYKKVWKYWNITKIDFATALVATIGVLFLGILQGLLLAIFLGLVGILLGLKSRSTLVLGKSPSETSYRSLENHPDEETYPGLLILRFGGSLFFVNAPDFAEEVRSGIHLITPKPKVVLVDAESINSVDGTAIITIKELQDELSRQEVSLRFAQVKTGVMDVMQRGGIEAAISSEHFYTTVQNGVDAYLSEQTSPS